EGARDIVCGQPTGRYDVDKIRAGPFPSGHTSRSWGRMIRHPDGRVEGEPGPWDGAKHAAAGGRASMPQEDRTRVTHAGRVRRWPGRGGAGDTTATEMGQLSGLVNRPLGANE